MACWESRLCNLRSDYDGEIRISEIDLASLDPIK
jgi:hypothetical protein